MVNARVFVAGIALLAILLSACARNPRPDPDLSDADFAALVRESPTVRK